VLKLTVPGVPDIYQGCELLDFSMVDPDNRRPVDFARREALLGAGADRVDREAGLDKLIVHHTLLGSRAARPDVFTQGSYEPVAVPDAGSDRICAFMRRHENSALVVAASRFPRRAAQPASWEGVSVPIPASPSGSWTNLFEAGATVGAGGEPVAGADLFSTLPFTVLVTRDMAPPT
jgi:(1->4)-alpha-D-glucan 1-alpha-D-glucosylmutase